LRLMVPRTAACRCGANRCCGSTQAKYWTFQPQARRRLYRFDQDLLVNTHAYGAPAGLSPILHLRRVPGGRIWDQFMQSFDKTWDSAEPQT
jgi:hypothetical protein